MAGGSPRGPLPARWLATELGARVVSAVVLAAAALAVTIVGGPVFSVFWLVAGIAVLVEWTTVTRVEPRLPLQIALGTALVAMTALFLAQAAGQVWLLCVGLALGAGAFLSHGNRDRFWSILGFACAAIIALVPAFARRSDDFGMAAVLWMFAVVWFTDIAAYFVGRGVGGPKLWPRVSPKKTWSGFAGGLAAGTLSGAAVVGFFLRGVDVVPPLVLLAATGMSALASLASQAGDLAELALKRFFDVKDSGRLIPGHGGALDRLDGFFGVSALLGAVFLFAYFYPAGTA